MANFRGARMKNPQEHYIVFGATEKPTKGTIAYAIKGGGCGLTICEIKEGAAVAYGDSFEEDDVVGVYTSLIFVKKESAESFLKAVQTMLDKWEE